MSTPTRIFVLSPHIDDAAFGLAITIAKCAGNKIPVTIINCFTVTRWTAVHMDNKEIENVSRLRKEEDTTFYKSIGNVTIINLDMLDAPLRNGYIFKHQPMQENELELVDELSDWLEKNVDGLLLCPLGIGDHIDHAICRAAVQKLYNKVEVLFYEDLPYARRITHEQLLNHIHKLEEELGVSLENNTSDFLNCYIDKEQMIRLYKSQMNEEIVSQIIGHLNDLKGERLWGETNVILHLKNEIK